MNDIDIAIMDGSTGRSGLLGLVKGCPEDSSGVSHAMVPIVFTGNSVDIPDVTVVNRAILKRDVTVNKQGVASMVMQVKIPYVRMGTPVNGGGLLEQPRRAVVTKDYISCHVVLALPKSMLTDWRDSNNQADAEVQLNTALLILNTWAQQYGIVTNQVAEATSSEGNLTLDFKRILADATSPSYTVTSPRLLTVSGKAGQRATSFKMPADSTFRDPLTDPLMGAFGGVCSEVRPSVASPADNLP